MNMVSAAWMRRKSRRFSLNHNLQNLHISLPHAVTAEASDVVDGFFGVAADDAVAAEEVAALLAHLVAEDARLHGEGDLAGTRGLGAVTDDTSRDA